MHRFDRACLFSLTFFPFFFFLSLTIFTYRLASGLHVRSTNDVAATTLTFINPKQATRLIDAKVLLIPASRSSPSFLCSVAPVTTKSNTPASSKRARDSNSLYHEIMERKRSRLTHSLSSITSPSTASSKTAVSISSFQSIIPSGPLNHVKRKRSFEVEDGLENG